jgi:HD-GYP domain-containing protein (c-di-GMP phosphodiesterase class II)
MPGESRDGSRVRLAEVVGALSLATDLGTGQPLEHGLRRALIAVWLGESLGLGRDELRDALYVALLGSVGCTIESTILAEFSEDDIAISRRIATVDITNSLEVTAFGIRNFGAGQSPLRRAATVARAATSGRSMFTEVCRDVALRLGDMLELGESIQQALAQCHERWNGRGLPRRLQGAEIRVAARLFHVAHDVEIFARLQGIGAAIDLARTRAGNQYDPEIATRFAANGRALVRQLDASPIWDAVMAVEPAPVRELSEREMDSMSLTVANFVDLRSPYTLGHSPGVARLAGQAGSQLGLTDDDAADLHRAGLFHDLGRTGVPVAVWNSTTPWSRVDEARARKHPALTELVLARSTGLGPIGTIAGLHHERLDGSGYRAVRGSFQPLAARILAAADTYHTKIEPRPHRKALSPDEAAAVLHSHAAEGHLDSGAVAAVLAVAGQRLRPAARIVPANLTGREIEVLRLIVEGLTNRQIGERLFISPKTADHHVEHIYDKIGASTRVGATLFAIHHGLVDTP